MRSVLLLLVLLLVSPAANAEVDVYFFWRDGCPHCERETEFLTRLKTQQPDLRVHAFNVWSGRSERLLLARVAEALKIDRVALPLTVVGNQVFVGYQDDATTGRLIAERIAACRATACPDVVPSVIGPGGVTAPAVSPVAPPDLPPAIKVPLIGELQIRELSLPALTVVLGAVDGFNPCAMWTLVFLIGLLASMRDRTRMWVLGGSFILASAAAYFLFMAAWLNALLFFGMIVWVRWAVALVAIAGGAYYLLEFARNTAAVCEITAPERRQRVLAKLREMSLDRRFVPAIAGIVVLAFAVNLVELVCSAGIPAVYTQVLVLNALPAWQYYAYLLLYVTVFMLDDLVVFFTAVKTLELTGLSTRYLRASHLVGGLVLFAIGALLAVKPEWLMFGSGAE